MGRWHPGPAARKLIITPSGGHGLRAIEELINRRLQSGGFKDAEDVILQALRASPPKPAEQSGDPRPIWDVILDNMKDVPAEEFAKLPKDGASEVDHYLYGHPKQEL